MRYERTITVKADAAHVWEILTDVTHWPEWTESMASVDLIGPPPLTLGTQVRIRQPRLPTTVWTVTDYTQGTHFTWSTQSPILTSVAEHHLTPNPDGTTTVRLTFDQWGPFSPLATLLTRHLVHRYVTLEAEGLKSRSEST